MASAGFTFHGIQTRFGEVPGAIVADESTVIGICAEGAARQVNGAADADFATQLPEDTPVFITRRSDISGLGSGHLRNAINLIWEQSDRVPIIAVRVAPAPERAAVAATLTIGEGNNAITFTAAAAGAAGNAVSVAIVRGTHAANFDITVAGSAITIATPTGAYNSDGLVTSFDRVPAARALATAAAANGNLGVPPLAAAANLAGGADLVPAGTAAEAAARAADAITGQLRGVRALQTASSRADIPKNPDIIIAPGLSDNAAVQTAIGETADVLRAIGFIDGPAANTDTAALAQAAAAPTNARLMFCDPWVVTTSGVQVPPSAAFAGAAARSDRERGYWASFSNMPLRGIASTVRGIGASLTPGATSAHTLNMGQVSTIIKTGGVFRTWGNRGLGSDSDFAFMAVRRTFDRAAEALNDSHQWAIDNTLTHTYFSEVSQRVNDFLSDLQARGAILHGECVPDADRNTEASLRAGQAWFAIRITPVYVAEAITFTLSVGRENLPLAA